MFILSKKIMRIRDCLKHWEKCEFGLITLKKLTLLYDLEQSDVATESHPHPTMENASVTNLRAELGLVVKQEKIYWKQ